MTDPNGHLEEHMDCPRCATPHSAAARFCARCGTPLHTDTDRDHHYAAHPDEPVRALALLSTLLPHVSGRRHHLYRYAVVGALIASLLAAAFGVLSVALVCAAIALPAIVLTYLHDYGVWRDEPAIVVGGGFLAALVLGGLLGALQRSWASAEILVVHGPTAPPASQVLELGVVVPVLVLVAVCLAPLLITSRPSFRHPIDAVNVSALSGAALSLGLSVIVQRGAFSHVVVGSTDPARTAFIALTLGFSQPILFAVVAALAVMRMRRAGANLAVGLGSGAMLLIANGIATTMLGSHGSRGIVLTALITAALAAVGLVLVRAELHAGLLADAQRALDTAAPAVRSATSGQVCSHCGAGFDAGATFCQICGTAVAAQQPVSSQSIAAGLAPSAA